MLQAYVDDTGNAQSKVFVFSALIGEAERMARLSDEWQSVLSESPSIRYFKMDEAESCNGQFYRFTAEERNGKLKRLCALLCDGSLTEFSFRTNMSIFNRTIKKASSRPMSEPYFFPFHATILGVAYEVLSMGAKEPFEIFFDEQVIFGPRAKAWYPIIRVMQEKFVQDILPPEPFFRDDEKVLPLQTSDLTAWIHRKANEGGLGEFQWLVEELKGLVRSPLSRELDERTARNILSPVRPSERNEDTYKAVMKAYRETFGHDWPPKNNLDRRKARGR